jgi:hypothetical protein
MFQVDADAITGSAMVTMVRIDVMACLIIILLYFILYWIMAGIDNYNGKPANFHPPWPEHFYKSKKK